MGKEIAKIIRKYSTPLDDHNDRIELNASDIRAICENIEKDYFILKKSVINKIFDKK